MYFLSHYLKKLLSVNNMIFKNSKFTVVKRLTIEEYSMFFQLINAVWQNNMAQIT